jgi:cytochrome c oxidase cbb3-type subunit 1
LFKLYCKNTGSEYLPKFNLIFWSISLFVGGISFLLGNSSGKLFLVWSAYAKYLFVLNLLFLWTSLFIIFYGQVKFREQNKEIIPFVLNKGLLLLGLLTVPFAFLYVLRPNILPSINTESSGATGVSLLLSSLAVVAIFIYSPLVLLETKLGASTLLKLTIALVLHIVVSLFLNLGNSSHYDLDQILGLTSILIWLPILIYYYKNLSWDKELSLWLKSFLCWGAFLVVTAVLMFQPGILDKVKFTNIIVAHVHIAMAGMITSFLMIVLHTLIPKGFGNFLIDKKIFILWQAGLSLKIISLLLLGIIEIRHFGIGYQSGYFNLVEVVRICGGLLMTFASHKWLNNIFKEQNG